MDTSTPLLPLTLPSGTHAQTPAPGPARKRAQRRSKEDSAPEQATPTLFDLTPTSSATPDIQTEGVPHSAPSVQPCTPPACRPDPGLAALVTFGLDALEATLPTADPDIVQALGAAAPLFEGAYTRESQRAKRRDLRRFATWARAEGYTPLASPAALSTALSAHWAHVQGLELGGSGLGAAGVALAQLATWAGLTAPVPGLEARRKLATRARQRTAQANADTTLLARAPDGTWTTEGGGARLSEEDLRALVAAIRKAALPPLQEARDLAVIGILCDTLMRASDIARLRLGDVLDDGVYLPSSKGDRRGDGVAFRLTPQAQAQLATYLVRRARAEASWRDCPDMDVPGATHAPDTPPPLAALRRPGDTVPLFTGLHSGRFKSQVKPFQRSAIARMVNRHAAAAGLTPPGSHAFRRAVAARLFAAGVPEAEIARLGRWTSVADMRGYVGLRTILETPLPSPLT